MSQMPLEVPELNLFVAYSTFWIGHYPPPLPSMCTSPRISGTKPNGILLSQEDKILFFFIT